MFIVVVKPSARKANSAAGRAVAENGPRRTFMDGENAEAWASRLSHAGRRRVWLRRAHPDDSDDVDAYLVSRHWETLADDPDPDGQDDREPLPDEEDARGPLAEFYADRAE